MKVAYITAHAPYGPGETFVLEEMLAMAEIGVDLVIIPRNPSKVVFHKDAQRLLNNTLWLPLLNREILLVFLGALLSRLRLWQVIWSILRHSPSPKILIKNLAVLPKSVFIASRLMKEKVEHIHAHWGSTTATMAWIASELAGIPWSMTLHRWDIAENNLLRLKVDRAAFVRVISEDGRREVLRIVGEGYRDKVKVLHIGVRLPDLSSLQSPPQRSHFVVACPANLVPKKGHRFLVEACKLLLERGVRDFRCLIIGDGPLEAEICQQVAELGLEAFVKLRGRLPHEELLEMYRKGEVDAVVLPSIVTEDGEKEGIPVSLMEAMAYRIPVVSTDTGGIPELIGNGAGIVVKEKDAQQLVDALERLIKDAELRRELGEEGYQKIYEEFNLRKNAEALLNMMTGAKREWIV